MLLLHVFSFNGRTQTRPVFFFLSSINTASLGENNNTNIGGSTKMIKTLIKLFMPSPKKLAKMAAERIQKVVNESNKA